MIEAQDQVLAQTAGMRTQLAAVGMRPMLLRNSRILIGLSFLGSAAALCISICMFVVAFNSFFPLHALTLDRGAAAGLWMLGAWLMAASQVYLWRQGQVMAHCSVSLDPFGAHFKLGSARNSKEVYMPWGGIAAIHYKRIPNAQKFTILGKDTTTVTFTSYAFYRPKKVARTIAQHAGLPLVRG